VETEQIPKLQKSTKIKKMVLDGFKSFGKRTELIFGDQFNVVLGPNGSGKSNILDALCFVLGKSSSKSLRAEKSANLIYNGGKSKKSASMAEVSIFFDNTSRIFNIPEDEVKLSRIVRKDGASKYKINNKTMTRNEVVEMLNSAKIDPDGYNIVLQGDIVSLVEMSPESRREIIEDIAGIGIYEEKKGQALKELAKVDEKLTECEIILKEREQSLKELKKDRDQALKYKELSDNIKVNKGSYLKIKIDKKEETKGDFTKKITSQKEKFDKLRAEIDKLRADINEKKAEIKKISDEIEQSGEKEQIDLNKAIEQIRVNIATKQTKIEHAQKEIHRIDQRKEQLSQNLGDIEEKRRTLEAQKKELVERTQSVESQVHDITKRLQEFREKQGLDNEDTLQKEMDSIDHAAEALQKELSAFMQQQQDILREKDKIEFQLQTIDQTIEKVEELEKQHEGELKGLKKAKEEFKKTVLELNNLLNADSADAAQIARLKSEVQKISEESAKLEVKQAGIREHMSGNIAITKVIENAKSIGKVYGRVSDLGSVPEKYTVALEAAASQRINSIVVEDDLCASKAIAMLKRDKLGTATFLPLNKIKPVPITAEMKKLAEIKGVQGFAMELVDYDSKFKDVFSYVFGSTLVVDTLATARQIGVGKIRMVTMEGDLCEFSGAMQGGYRHKRHGSFREKEMESKIHTIAEELEDARAKLQSLETKRAESEEKIVRLRELKANLEGEIIKQEKSLHLDTGDLESTKQYKKELTAKLTAQSKLMAEIDDKVSEKTDELTNIKIKKQEVKKEFVELRSPTVLAELNAFEQKKQELNEQKTKLTNEQTQIELQLKEVVSRDKENTETILKEMAKEKQKFQSEAENMTKELKTDETELKQKEKAQQAFQSKHKALFQKRNDLSDNITVIESKVLQTEEVSRKEELTLNTLQLQEAQINAEMAGLKQEFLQYEGLELNTKKDEAQLKKEINDFEKMLANIGSVNLRALDTYDAAEKAYSELQQKSEVLTSEKQSVLSLMQEIETDKTKLFKTSLDVINGQFQRIFKDLSTKGEAYLELENPESPFEAGLRIKVKLTGDKFMDIRSLSGGEKTMTALAFIFAIQEHEPASFYILDEVDAALDKANADKLAGLIQKYCGRAQYIIISHNDNVILKGDVLYGVSMNSALGLSNVVSLKA